MSDPRIEAAAAAIANARGARRGAPAVANILDVLKASDRLRRLYDEVMEDATAAIAAADRARDNHAEAEVGNLAAGLAEPVRQAEVTRHHRALLAALNGSYTPPDRPGGRPTQDPLAVFEALAMLIGQLIGNMNGDAARGSADFIRRRALHYAPAARAASAAADVEEEDAPEGRQ